MYSYRILKCIKVIGILIALCGCSKNEKSKRLIDIKEIGWSFQIQAGTKFKDSSFDSRGNIIQGYRKVATQDMIPLFTLKEDSNNWFSALIIKDSLSLESWRTQIDADNKWYFEEVSLIPNIKIIDTIYSDEIIDEINFKKEYIKLYNQVKNDTIWYCHYYAKFKLYELAINYTFTNKLIGKSYFEIFGSSKFKK